MAKPKMPYEAGKVAMVEDGQPWNKDRQDQGRRKVVGDGMLRRARWRKRGRPDGSGEFALEENCGAGQTVHKRPDLSARVGAGRIKPPTHLKEAASRQESERP